MELRLARKVAVGTVQITLAVGALAAAASGCGSSSGHSSSSTTHPRARTPAPPAGRSQATVRSGHSHGSGVIRIAGIGSLSYRCDPRRQRVSATLGGRIEATEGVYVEGDGRRHLRAASRVAQPFSVDGARTRTMLWHVIQSTEPRTVDVRVLLVFGAASGRAATAIGCASTRWTTTIYVIPHDKAWSPPPVWL
jgi:hypothetical protein